MDDYGHAEWRAHRLARRLLREGVDAGAVMDALFTQAVAMWAATTGLHADAASLTKSWGAIREATDGN